MLARLLESEAKNDRSVSSALLSITAHTAIIGAAVYATAHARSTADKPADVYGVVHFQVVPALPRSEAPALRLRHDNPSARRWIFVQPTINTVLPPAIETLNLIGNDFKPTELRGLGEPVAGRAAPNRGSDALTAEQVEKQVRLVAGSSPPRYPEALRVAGIEGKVTAVFIVGEEGLVEESSVRFVEADNQLFEEAVKVALSRMRFLPAEIAGRKVRQLVQMPFVFTLKN